MKSLFQKAISARPSAAQALQHDWLKNDAQTGEFLSQIEIQNLKSFSNFHKVKKGALTVIASQLSDSRIEDLKKTFLGIDQNADGTLSIAELKQGLKTAGIKIPRDLAQVLEQVDTDGSGVLDYTEFLAATIDKKVYTQEAIVWAAFRKFDRDGSGSIDKNELMNVLGDDALKDEFSLIGDQDELSKIFNEIDVNGDGVIDFEEFFAMVRVAEEGARDSVQDKPRRSPKTGPMQSPKGSKNSPKGPRQQSKTSPENSRNASPKQTVNIGLGAVSQSPAYM
jgi:calcium-dependent protein kinase